MNLIEHLAEYVSKQPDFQEAQPAFVSIYRCHRCYGGPEEGGWWFDRNELVGSKPFLSVDAASDWLEAAKVEVERLNAAEAPARARAMASLPDCDQEPLPDAGEGYIPKGWDDGGELCVVVEEQKGSMDNMREPNPHYE
jgi:hypothetical protein